MRKMKTTFHICIALAIVGTASGQNMDSKLIFYRPKDNLGGAFHASIRIDGSKPTHKVPNGRYWTTDIAAGEYFIYGDDIKDAGQKYQLESGKTYYFRIEQTCPTAEHAYIVAPKCKFVPMPVTAEFAAPEIAVLKPDKS
jgi:hypothetical protein